MNHDWDRERERAEARRDQPRRHAFYRSRTNRIVAGVSGGLGEATGIDANLFRLLFLILALFGGMGLVIYAVMAIVVPERPRGGEVVDASSRPQLERSASRAGGVVIGVFIILIGMFLLASSLGLFPTSLVYLWELFSRLFWPTLLIGLGVLLVIVAFWGDRDWWRHIQLPAPGRVLYRSRSNRVIAGVSAGLAEYFNVDPWMVRVIWVIGTIITFGAGLFIYIAAALILPEER